MHSLRVDAGVALCDERVAAAEVALAQVDPPAEPGLPRRGVGRDVGRPVQVALLHPQRVDRPVADIDDAVRPPGRAQQLVHVGRVRGGDVQLPAELADVADAHRQHRRRADRDLARRARSGTPRCETSSSHTACSTSRASGPQRLITALAEVRSRICTLPSSGEFERIQPMSWAPNAEPVTTYQCSLAEARHRQVALDAAALVAQLRVRDRADRLVHVGHRQPLHSAERAGPGDLELGERRLVDQGDALADGAVLLAPTCVNQFGSPNDGRSTASTPAGANQFGRSHPPREPNTAPCAASVSCSGLRFTPRAVTCSLPGAASL